MMSQRSRNRRIDARLAAAALAVSLAGCAAVEINVDVYKGPLANNEEVQVRQFTTLVSAAKPLIQRLRDLYNTPRDGTSTERQVQLLNEVLALYEDDRGEFLDRQTDRVRAEWIAYAESVARLTEARRRPVDSPAEKPGSGTPLRRPSNAFEIRAFTEERIVRKERDRPSSEQAAKAFVDNIRRQAKSADKCIAEQLAGFLFGPWRANTDESPAASTDETRPCISQTLWQSRSRPDRYRELQRDESRRRIISKVLGAEAPRDLSRQLDKHLEEIGDGFFKAREAGLSAWRAEIDLLRDVMRLPGAQPLGAGTSAIQPSRDRALERTGSPREQALRAVASLLAKTTQPRELACALLHYADEAKEHSTARFAAKLRAKPDVGNPFARNKRDWKRETYALANEILAETLVSEGLSALLEIEHLHSGFIRLSAQDLQRCATELYEDDDDKDDVRSVSDQRFGLVRGPFRRDDGPEALLQPIDALVEFENLGTLGLRSGRGPSGLQTLASQVQRELDERSAEQRKRARDVPPMPSGQCEICDSQLYRDYEHALIQFAEKIRFVATYHFLVDYQTAGSQLNVRDRGLLEALGNTILAQVDDLRNQRRHRDRSAELAGFERSTAAIASKDQAERRFAALLARIQGELAAAGQAVEKRAVFVKAMAPLAEAYGLLQAGRCAPAAKGRQACSPTDPLAVEALRRLPGKQKADAARETLVAWLGERIAGFSAINADSPARQRLVNAQDYLKSMRVPESPTFERADEAWSALLAHMKPDHDAAAAQLQQLAKSAPARDEAAPAGSDPIRTEQLRAAAERLPRVRAEVLGEDPARLGSDREMLVSVRAALDRAVPTASDKALHANAIAVIDRYLATTPPSSAAALVGGRPGAATSMDRRTVLDELIAVLRYRRIEALERGDQVAAENLHKALEEAHAQRGGMAFLRPSSAYLRSVYPAGHLQPDPSSRDNLLGRASLRALPLEPEMRSIFRLPEHRGMDEVLGALDKNFWQNINTVRLSGAGRSNYVLAKDDVGNWYVKAYAADTEPILKSAQNLLLFNLGMRAGTNLLKLNDLQRRLASETNPATRSELNEEIDQVAGRSSAVAQASERALSRRQADYDDQARSHRAELLGLLNGQIFERARDRIRVTLAAKLSDEDLKALLATLESRNADLKTEWDRLNKTEDSSRLPSAIVDGLRALQHYRNEAMSGLLRTEIGKKARSDLDATSAAIKNAGALGADALAKLKSEEAVQRKRLEDALGAPKEAARDVAAIVNPEVDRLLRMRRESNRRLEIAVTVLGEATMPAAAEK